MAKQMYRERGLIVTYGAAILFILACNGVLGRLGDWPDNLDNWTYWELSLNLHRDFYHVWNVRSFAAAPDYSTAYPPLYPALIAAADAMTGLGPAAGTLVNYVSVAAFAVVNAEIGRHVAGSRAVGLSIAAATLCFLPFANEVVGARSHPVALLILASIGLVIVRGPITSGSAGLIGLLSGLSVMTRFDFLLPSVVLGALMFFWSRRLGPPIAFSLSATVSASPWIIYSWARFHSIYVSDSRWSAAARKPGLWSNDWVAPPGPEPMAGVGDILRKLVLTADVPVELFSDYVRHLAPLILVLASAIAAAILTGRFVHLPAWANSQDGPGRLDWNRLGRLATLMLLWPPLVLSAWLASYPSVRYLTGMHWNLVLVAFVAGAHYLNWRKPTLFRPTVFLAAIGFAVLGGAFAWRLSTTARFERQADVRTRVAAFKKCLTDAGAHPVDRVLFATNEVQAAQFGPMAQWSSSSPPHNSFGLSQADWSSFLDHNAIRYIVAGSRIHTPLKALMGVEPIPGCPTPIHPVTQPLDRHPPG